MKCRYRNLKFITEWINSSRLFLIIVDNISIILKFATDFVIKYMYFLWDWVVADV